MSNALGVNALDTLTRLGVDANAYTTSTYTTYLFESIDNFYDALDEYMDYVQNPYFTEENIKKERGIIEQEISMYDDDPNQVIYMNLMNVLYHNNPIKLDVAGTKESISKITEKTLYTIYNNFYVPENMVIMACGDFNPEELLENIKRRITLKSSNNKIERVYDEEPDTIVEKQVTRKMKVSMPAFMVGYKDKIPEKNMMKKDIALQILSEIILGKSSKLFKRLYDEKLITSGLGFSYEYGRNYAHCIIQGMSEEPERVIEEIKNEIEFFKARGINDEDFERTKKKIYGEAVIDFDEPSVIVSQALERYFNGIEPFAFFEEYESVKKEDLLNVLKEVFNEDKKAISIIEVADEEEIDIEDEDE